MGMYNSVSFKAVCKPGPGLDAWVAKMEELFEDSHLEGKHIDLEERPDGLVQVGCTYYGESSYGTASNLSDHVGELTEHATEPFTVEDGSDDCEPYVVFPEDYPAPKSGAMQFLLVEAFKSEKTVSAFLKGEVEAALAAHEAWLRQEETQP